MHGRRLKLQLWDLKVLLKYYEANRLHFYRMMLPVLNSWQKPKLNIKPAAIKM